MSFYVAGCLAGATVIAYGARQYLTPDVQPRNDKKVPKKFGLSSAVVLAIAIGAGLIYSGATTSKISESPVPPPALPLNPKVINQIECGVSRSHTLATPSFGPCHLLTGYHKKTHTVFMAHIDDLTDVSSLSGCLEPLKNIIGLTGNEAFQQLDWKLSGGWREHEESAKWGKLILEEMRKYGVPLEKIDRTFYQQKQMMTSSKRHASKTHYFGAQIHPINGSLSFLDSVRKEWDQNSATQLRNKVEKALFDKVRASGIEPKHEDFKTYYEIYQYDLSLPLEVTVY